MFKEETVAALTQALRPWVQEAMEQVKERPDLMAELRACMDGDGDLRVGLPRPYAITLEATDYSAGTCAKLMRNYLIPLTMRGTMQ